MVNSWRGPEGWRSLRLFSSSESVSISVKSAACAAYTSASSGLAYCRKKSSSEMTTTVPTVNSNTSACVLMDAALQPVVQEDAAASRWLLTNVALTRAVLRTSVSWHVPCRVSMISFRRGNWGMPLEESCAVDRPSYCARSTILSACWKARLREELSKISTSRWCSSLSSHHSPMNCRIRSSVTICLSFPKSRKDITDSWSIVGGGPPNTASSAPASSGGKATMARRRRVVMATRQRAKG
mmetsp:Transcript_26574/g.79374  ORF Transcript_26574/g.79374 Transcript_26574/m.79374 type:complete len:240 (-) Transcript_26574:161-880(-)